MKQDEQEFVTMTEAQRKARRNRSIALGVALAAFVAIMYLLTVVKMGPGVLNRPM